jgi:2-haloalkanoic acid dehalogenase type II
MPRVIVCDVNETLLDVGALEPHFKQAFGDGRVLQDWFANVLLYSEVATLAGPYSDFASIAGAALDMVASARGMTLSVADRSRILQGMLTLPAHPDVRDGLQTMRDAGLRLVTLTNSAPAAVQQQLTNAGLTARSSNAHSLLTPCVASSRPPRRTSRSQTRSDCLSIVFDSCACVGYRGRAPRGMRSRLRREAREGPLSARTKTRH